MQSKTSYEERDSATLVGNAAPVQMNSQIMITKPTNSVKTFVDRHCVKDKRTIYVTEGGLDSLAQDIELAISHDDKVFFDAVFGLISLGKNGDKNVMTKTKLRIIAMNHATFLKEISNGKYRVINCPLDACDAVLSLDEWPNVRVLKGITRNSLILTNGHFINKPGYDDSTGVYALHMGCYPSISASVSKDEAMNSFNNLCSLLKDFPFDTTLDLVAAIAMLISALLRPVMRTCPMALLNASNPGSGKTTLAQLFSVVAIGKPAAILSWSEKNEELEKRLFGFAKQGIEFALFDNVMHDIDDRGGILSGHITGSEIMSRKLGTSDIETAKTNFFIVATGNNIGPLADMARRTITIRLTPNVENPESKNFEREIIEFTTNNRELIIKDILTVVKGWFDAGCHVPNDISRAGSFQDWERLARFPLLWLDQPDPWLAVSRGKNLDPEKIAFDAFIKTLIETIGLHKDFSVECLLTNREIMMVIPDSLKDRGFK